MVLGLAWWNALNLCSCFDRQHILENTHNFSPTPVEKYCRDILEEEESVAESSEGVGREEAYKLLLT